MSADNFIGVHRKKNKWYVSEGSMSILDEDCQYRGYEDSAREYPTRNNALVAAHDMYRDYSIVEYGVIELNSAPEPFCCRCYVCINERKMIAPDIERCTLCGEPFTNSDWRTGTHEGTFHTRCEPR